MELFDQLTDDNFVEYCSEVCDKRYVADLNDLQNVLRYVGYIKRLFTEFETSGELKERLILNHIIILSNVFGPEHTSRILFFKAEKRHYAMLKTFLSFLNMMPLVIDRLETPIYDRDIPINSLVHSKLLDI